MNLRQKPPIILYDDAQTLVAQLWLSFSVDDVEMRKDSRDAMLKGKRVRLKEEEELQEAIPLEKFKEILQHLKQKKCSQQELQQIKQAVTQGDAFISEFLKFPGSLYALIGQLTSQNPQHQLQAAACITNLALGQHQSTFHVLKASSAYLITFLYSNNYLLQDQCAWALGNMAADCAKCSEHLKVQGIVSALLYATESPHQDVVLSATFALRCYSIYQNRNFSASEKEKFMTTLASLLHSKEIKKEALSNVLFVFFHLSTNIFEWESFFQGINLVTSLLNIFEDHIIEEKLNILISTPIVRCLGNISAGSMQFAREIGLWPNFATVICKLLNSNYIHMRKEVLWFLTNLVAKMKDISEVVGIEDILKCIPLCLSSSIDVYDQALCLLLEIVSGGKQNCVKVTSSPGLLEAVQQSWPGQHVEEKIMFEKVWAENTKP